MKCDSNLWKCVIQFKLVIIHLIFGLVKFNISYAGFMEEIKADEKCVLPSTCKLFVK